MPQFVHMAADDPERAARFFEDVFGWRVTKLEGPMPYWLIATGDDATAIGGGIARREAPWQSMTPKISVSSVDHYADRITQHGGTIVVPKTPIPGIGQLLTFRDSEGNVFAILEPVGDNPFVDKPAA